MPKKKNKLVVRFRKFRSSKLRILMFVILFAAAGAAILHFTLAAQLSQNIEDEQFTFLNNFRIANGKAPLKRSYCLTNAAQNWSTQMATNIGFHHSSLIPYVSGYCPWSTPTGLWGVGENLAFAAPVNSQAAFNALVNSTGHRENMLGDYNYVGLGAYLDDNHGLWITQEFGKCSPSCTNEVSNPPGQAPTTPVISPYITNAVGVAGKPHGSGFWAVDGNGRVINYPDALHYGDMDGKSLNKPIVGMAATPSGGGYWLVASDGGIFAFGNAGFYGSTGGMSLNKPIVGMKATPSGGGYWLVASDGGIFAFGDARFFGSTGGMTLNKPIVNMAVTPSGNGYWLVASDGGIFAFGDAGFYGSTGSLNLSQPIVDMVPNPTGGGYWLVARDGGVFAFGTAKFYGSAGGSALAAPVIGMSAMPDGLGYSIVLANGEHHAYGSAVVKGISYFLPNKLPTAPTNLAPFYITGNYATITWKRATDDRGVAAYNIYRNGKSIGTSKATNFTATGMYPGSTYTFQVSAIDSNFAEGPKSNKITITTKKTIPPTSPNLTSFSHTSNSISLSWTKPEHAASGVKSYVIYMVNPSYFATTINGIATVPASQRSFTVKYLASGTTYHFIVRALDYTNQLSLPSNQIDIKTN